MTNVSIAPGAAGSLEDLIADTDDGILLETNRSWSIDDRRLHFQFGTEVGHRHPRRRARAGSSATRPTPGSRRSSGGRWTPSARSPRGASTGCSTAARASPASSCACRTGPRPRGSATWRSASPDGRGAARARRARAVLRRRRRAGHGGARALAVVALRPLRRRRRRPAWTTRPSRSSACATGTPRRRPRTASTRTRCAPRRARPTPSRAPLRARDTATTPGCPAAVDARPAAGWDAETAELDPARRADGAARGVPRRRRRRAGGVRAVDRGRRAHRDRHELRASARPTT